MGDSKYVDVTGSGGQGRDINAPRSNAFYNFLTGAGSSGSASNALAQALAQYGRTGSEQYGELASALPGISAGAGAAADAATQAYGMAAQDYARQQSEANRRAIEQRLSTSGLGNFASGAGLASIAQGASQPYAEALQNVANLRSQAYMGAYSPAAQATYANILGRGQQYANLGNLLTQALAGQSEQQIMAPSYQLQQGFGDTLLSGLMTGLGGAAGSYLGTSSGSNWLAGLLGGGGNAGGQYTPPGYGSPGYPYSSIRQQPGILDQR